MVAAAAAYAVLWLLLRDQAVTWSEQIAELLGSLAVYAMTVSAVLAVKSPRIDRLFGGPKTRQDWHRVASLAGLGLILTHLSLVTESSGNQVGKGLGVLSLLLLSSLLLLALPAPSGRAGRWRGPLGWIARMPYDWWKAAHRLTAVSLLAGMAHGLVSATVLPGRPVLTLVYLGICTIGVSALGYQLVVRRFIARGAPHRVARLEQITGDVRTFTLRPEGTAWSPRPGQFVEVRFAGVRHGAHPFTVVGFRSDGRIQIAVKASGNDTAALHRKVALGARAWVSRPRGDFDHLRVGRRQIWIAGGIGITPFLSWIRALGTDHDAAVDLWYSVHDPAQAAFLDELTYASQRLPWLTLHLVRTDTGARLTAERVLAESLAGPDAAAFLCGPTGMVDALGAGLTAGGLTGPVLRETFSPR